MADADNDKPFPCSSPGCTKRFANEDHLSIHKKRHMSLSIDSNGSKSQNFIAADETPTPTRFIRNCEEVGLFQDLQNVNPEINPFDEQFRRAAEVTLTSPTNPTTDDALHTPHVFPSSSEATTEPNNSGHPRLPRSGSVRGSNRNYLMPSLSISESLTLASPLCTPVPPTTAAIPTPTITITAPSESPPCKLTKTSNGKSRRASTAAVSPASSPSKTGKDRGRKTSLQSTVTKSVPSTGVNILPRPLVQAPAVPAASDPLTALLVRLPDGRLMQIPAIPVPTDESSSSRVSSIPVNVVEQSAVQQPTPRQATHSETKMKLKQALNKAKISTPQISSDASPSIASDGSLTDTELGLLQHDNSMDAEPKTTNSNSRRPYENSASDPDLDDEESEKRRKFLERNRAAAYRSRQKRKKWVKNLETKTAAMNAANRMLQNEVISLRSEVAQLKVQLLAHKECPVTLAMCQQSNNNNVQRSENVTQPNTLCQTEAVALMEQQAPRQIIILNATSSNSAGMVNNKPSQPSLMVVPSTTNVDYRPTNVVPSVQPSVIMSLGILPQDK